MPRPTIDIPPIRVLIVDADRRVRESLADLIRCDPALATVGLVGTPAEAVEAVLAARPDVVVIDPRLPELDAGLGLMAHLRATSPGLRVLVMGWPADADVGAWPADGLLDKGAAPDDLVAAIAASGRRSEHPPSPAKPARTRESVC